MPARALLDHGCQTKSHCSCPGVDQHTYVTSHPWLAMELSSLVCLHLHAQQSTCHKQADNMQTCQNHRSKAKDTLILSSTTGICRHIQSTQPTLIPFFLSLSSEPTSNTECRRTADSNSFSCSQWLLQTWTEYFDFNKSKWATQLCFIKGSSD